MNEIKTKLEKIRALMDHYNFNGVRLRGVDWFAWATGGGNSVVIFTSEVGIAEVFITPTKAWVLTTRIERDRLVQEEIPKEFEVVSFPWEDTHAYDKFIESHLEEEKICASDRPCRDEEKLPFAFHQLKLVLCPEEIERYRKVGKLAAEAMTEAIQKAEPNWSEDRLAGEGARSLWSRGLDPTLVMVGGEKRVPLYRHPIATAAPLDGYAMMVFCARGYGLYANLTRFIFFREPTPSELENFQKVAEVEAMTFDRSRPGKSLSTMYSDIQSAYATVGRPEEIHKHHQGGTTGYQSREHVATPDSPAAFKIENNTALAWNPSLPGAKIEDTVLATQNGIEILTVDPHWPAFSLQGRQRPDILIKK